MLTQVRSQLCAAVRWRLCDTKHDGPEYSVKFVYRFDRPAIKCTERNKNENKQIENYETSAFVSLQLCHGLRETLDQNMQQQHAITPNDDHSIIRGRVINFALRVNRFASFSF